MGEFIGSVWFFVIGGVLLLGLVGLLFVLRNKRDQD
ncbi:MAG: LPXTG cell wall anchor domain-containing protein [Gemmataceae bacterium]|nr:LPXTG cell wall anchor domain-containing protein [Gemmataceae bacterium]